MIALLAAGLAYGADAELAFDRVDVIAADPGTFVNYDLPAAGYAVPTGTIVRFVEQVQAVWSTPISGMYLGASISSQNVVMEFRVTDLPVPGVRLVPDPLFVYGGVQAVTLLPRGLVAGAGYRLGPVRASLGLSVLSNAQWRRLDYGHWHLLPTLSVGIGREHASEE